MPLTQAMLETRSMPPPAVDRDSPPRRAQGESTSQTNDQITPEGALSVPAVLAAFFWKRATPAGGVASIAAGMATTLAWEALKRVGAVPPALAAYDTVFFALAASVTALVLVSLATPAPPASRWRPFFQSEPLTQPEADS